MEEEKLVSDTDSDEYEAQDRTSAILLVNDLLLKFLSLLCSPAFQPPRQLFELRLAKGDWIRSLDPRLYIRYLRIDYECFQAFKTMLAFESDPSNGRFYPKNYQPTAEAALAIAFERLGHGTSFFNMRTRFVFCLLFVGAAENLLGMDIALLHVVSYRSVCSNGYWKDRSSRFVRITCSPLGKGLKYISMVALFVVLSVILFFFTLKMLLCIY